MDTLAFGSSVVIALVGSGELLKARVGRKTFGTDANNWVTGTTTRCRGQIQTPLRSPKGGGTYIRVEKTGKRDVYPKKCVSVCGW